MNRAAVVGAGNWGTTFAKVLADAGNDVTLWARRTEVADELNAMHTNEGYVPGVELPSTLRATADLDAAVRGAELVFLSLPAQQLRLNLPEIGELLGPETVLVSLMKGLERGTTLRMTQVIEETLAWPAARLAVLSGPNLASEIAKEEPAAAAVAAAELDLAERVARAVETRYFHAFPNDDVAGTEFGGALKNLIAVAVGIVHGVGYGENARALIITRGLAEITGFAVALGGKERTMMGLAGLGDLIATCESPLSRNHTAGRLLGQGKPLDEVIASMRQTAEGLSTVQPVLDLAHAHGITMPIVEQVARVLDGSMDPRDIVPVVSR